MVCTMSGCLSGPFWPKCLQLEPLLGDMPDQMKMSNAFDEPPIVSSSIPPIPQCYLLVVVLVMAVVMDAPVGSFDTLAVAALVDAEVDDALDAALVAYFAVPLDA